MQAVLLSLKQARRAASGFGTYIGVQLLICSLVSDMSSAHILGQARGPRKGTQNCSAFKTPIQFIHFSHEGPIFRSTIAVLGAGALSSEERANLLKLQGDVNTPAVNFM